MWQLDAFREAIGPGDLIRSVAVMAVASLIGYLLYRVLLARVRRGNAITTWGGDTIILAAIHDVVLVWFTIGGAAVATRLLPFDDEITRLINRGLIAVVIVSGAWVGSRLVGDVVRMLALRSGTAGKGSSIFLNVARLSIFSVGVLMLLQTFGVQIGPLLAALGVGGVALAFALQDTMKNFFAGVSLLATKKVRPGHYVRLDSGEEGYIVDIDWRHTSMRELPDNMVLVPNAKLADAVITNFDYPARETSLLVDARVHLGSDLSKVERVTVDVANEVMEEVEGAVPDHAPFIRFHTFGDYAVHFKVILRIRDAESQHLVKHEFLKRLKERYRREAITIPYPTISQEGSAPPGSDGDTRRRRAAHAVRER